MFNGIINIFSRKFHLKYFKKLNLIFVKFFKNFLILNIGESITISGICVTLMNKNYIFYEFEFSYGTFLNVSIFKKIYFNFEKCFNFFDSFNGHYIYGHINNIFLLKSKLIIFNLIKIFVLTLKIFKSFLIYKLSLCLNGISLTINEIIFLNNFILLSFNILNFTYFFTDIKYINFYDFFNIEIDNFFFFIIKIIFN